MNSKNSGLTLRMFVSQFDGPRIALWINDDRYNTYFRNNAFIPSFEDCMQYPHWSQNLIMMVDDDKGNTIGMASAYHANYKSRVIKAGMLIDANCQRKKYGHNAQTMWLEYLFKKLGFRKIVVENIHEHFTDPYIKVGFKEEGRLVKEAFVNGEYLDEIRMSCFAEEFKPYYYDIVERDEEHMNCQVVDQKVALSQYTNPGIHQI